MFEKRKYFDKLESMIDQGTTQDFILAYQTAPFNIDEHDPMFGRDKVSLLHYALKQDNLDIARYLIQRFELKANDAVYNESLGDLLETAMIYNRPSIAEHLIDRMGIEAAAEWEVEYEEDGDTYKATLLYRALDLGMEGVIWRLLKAPMHCDIEGGLEERRLRYNAATKLTESYWSEIDTTFERAEKYGDGAIVKALYDIQINDLEAQGRDIRDNAFFFPKWRANRIERKLAEFRAERDEVVGQCPRNSEGPRNSQGPAPRGPGL